MRTLKYIGLVLILGLTVSVYSTGRVVKLFNHIVNVESSYYPADLQDTESSESVEEVDTNFACLNNSTQKLYTQFDRFYNITCLFPSSPCYSIWLPPDIA